LTITRRYVNRGYGDLAALESEPGMEAIVSEVGLTEAVSFLRTSVGPES
jgi:hypothetical protein